MSLADSQPTIRRRTEVIRKERLAELPVHVLCPCATDSTINSSNAPRIRAEIVCAGANNPVTYKAVRALFERDILYFPDFVTNSGGALGNMVKFAGLPEKYLHRILDDELVHELRAVHDADITVALLNEKFTRMTKALERQNRRSALRELALSAYRNGMIPKHLIRPFAIKKIKQSVGTGIV